MPAEVKTVLAELIDTTTDDIGIVGHLIAGEHGAELTDVQTDALEAVRSALRTSLQTLKTAQAAFKA